MVQLSSVAVSAPPVALASIDREVQQARAEINDAGRYLYEIGALSAARTFNAAVRLSSGRQIVVAGFQPRDSRGLGPLIQVDLDTNAIEGDDDPALHEIAATYAVLFDAKPKISAAVHTRSPHLAAFAVAHRPLPVVYGAGLLKKTPVPAPVAPWTARLSADTLLSTLSAHPLAPAVLLGNRGVLAWGDDSVDKVARFVLSLEEVATIVIRAQALGGARDLPPGAYEAVRNSIGGD